MKKSIFITTTLPYANSTPHIGHCLEFVQADALARFYRKDHHVVLNIGLDEHGLKIYQTAKALNIPTKQFVDDISLKWKDFCKLYQISYDLFYRTSSPEHHQHVQDYWEDLRLKGDIYKKQYVGKYCVGCEEFKTKTQLEYNKCTIHPHLNIQDVSEENWFLRLSNYKESILNYVLENESFIKPISKHNELINVIKSCEDISISRKRDQLPWGVEVPNDPTQTIYVWFEALLNYLFAIGYDDWNNKSTTIQLCGPDNLKFQGLIWQGILLANSNKLTDHILIHGTILDENGVKMSKSIGNVVDPINEFAKYGLNAVRYYILRGLDTYLNSCWNSKDLIALYNADLVNNYGNLLARVLHLIDINNIEIAHEHINKDFKFEITYQYNQIVELWKTFNISHALIQTNALSTFGNKYVNETKPWTDTDQKSTILNNLYYLLWVISDLYDPVISETSQEIKRALQSKKKTIIFNKIV